MDFEKRLKGIVNTLPKTKILLIDGSDQRSIEAANKLAEFNNLEITLLVENDDKIDTKANVVNMNKDANKLELLAQKYVELRKGKEDIEVSKKGT
nr:phosphate acyltransferase [Mycoplasmopsis bovis]